jgi:glycine C-acetyltransferase
VYGQLQEHLSGELAAIESAGLFKRERLITTPQSAHVGVSSGAEVLNLCANNYLGLAQHPAVNAAARDGLREWGYGMASVRFIELNHASIIDGVRLSKASRYRYRNSDMADLEEQLKAADAAGARFKLVTTDGVFSMDGYIARLDEICDLAEKYNALVHFDDAHATGFIGADGKGTHQFRNCMDRVDIITGTLGKALGGASGGFTAARREIVELLRQRSRPYLFSNSVAPPVVAGALKALELVSESTELRDRLRENTGFFRERMQENGFELLPGEHPIVPVMLHDAALAGRFADAMLQLGVYVVAFSYPVVPTGQARIRTQISAALTRDDLELAIDAFARVKKELAV